MDAEIAAHSIEQLVERRIREWEFSRQRGASEKPSAPPDLFDFVAISRTAGSRGTDIAMRLGERLGWPVFDQQILHVMAGSDELRERLYRALDEHDLGWVEESCRAQFQSDFYWTDYFQALVETTLSLARKGHAVFLGRGTDLILPRSRGLRVRIEAPLEFRTRNFSERHGLDSVAARQRVEEIDRSRSEFVRHHFPIGADRPNRFDLTLNLERVTAEASVEILLTALQALGIVRPTS